MKTIKSVLALSCLLIFSSCGDDGGSKSKNKTSDYFPAQQRDVRATGITDTYGALKVKPGKVTYEADIKPWSGHWYPIIERELFHNPNGDSPLEKYDNYVNNRFNAYAGSRDNEANRHDRREAAWAGLCHAWAVASVLHKEPTRGSTSHGVDFTVGDKKALLIKSYSSVTNLKIFGDRYDGDDNDDYKDVYPDQFHRFTVKWLGENKKPFIMDYDASFPVWTVPVYKAKFDIQKQDANTMLVKAWITIATPFVHDHNYVGTKHSVKTYIYKLFGNFQGDEFIVNGGEWSSDEFNNSVSDHPDYVIEYPSDVNRATDNSKLSIETIDQIVGAPRRN